MTLWDAVQQQAFHDPQMPQLPTCAEHEDVPLLWLALLPELDAGPCGRLGRGKMLSLQ
jgi:hypothetical protein